jgi:hypothetical protein
MLRKFAVFSTMTQKQKHSWRASGLALLALFLVQLCGAPEITKDDIEFRKFAYTKKKGEHLPYRLYVPLGYSADRKYPLVLWLHGGEGRGSDNVRQISKGNEKGSHVWTTREAQDKLPRVCLGAAMLHGRKLGQSGPESTHHTFGINHGSSGES